MGKTVVLLAGSLLLLLVGLAQAGGRETLKFKNATLFGSYVVAFRGSNQPNPPSRPSNSGGPIQGIVGVGFLIFDGHGKITDGTISVNFNGLSETSNDLITGTYSVGKSGLCFISLVGIPEPLGNFWNCAVDDDDGNHVHFVDGNTSSSSFNLYDGTLTKQR
jgi:hypothetical protein